LVIWRDFRDYVAEIERVGDARLVEGAECDLEIGGLTELMAERRGPMLVFDSIPGYPKGYRVVPKPYATARRTSIALGLPEDQPPMQVLRAWREKTRDYQPLPPEAVASGPVMEHVLEGDDVDLTRFPAPKWHERDGGPYFGTGTAVITREPEDGWVNVGTYRAMLHDARTTGMEIGPYHHGKLHMDHWWALGKSCPMVIAIGVDPQLFLSATNALPWGSSELDYAGFLRGEPEEVIIGPRTGLPMPARAELILEGEIPPPSEEQRLEGPFGEYTGYYAGGEKMQPVVRVKAIYHRSDPILHGDPPLKPPIGYFGCQLMGSHLAVWNGLEKATVGIKGTYALNAGGSMFTVVAIKQHYAGHASTVGRLASGLMHGPNHVIVVVDDDIDPSDPDDVLWAVATRSDPATTWEIQRDCPTSTLDPTVSPERKRRGDFVSSRAVINACRPWSWLADFAPVNRNSDALRERIADKWRALLT
jgi:4-hydroxy-3-polyprenylbenzoate decarboxylase